MEFCSRGKRFCHVPRPDWPQHQVGCSAQTVFWGQGAYSNSRLDAESRVCAGVLDARWDHRASALHRFVWRLRNLLECTNIHRHTFYSKCVQKVFCSYYPYNYHTHATPTMGNYESHAHYESHAQGVLATPTMLRLLCAITTTGGVCRRRAFYSYYTLYRARFTNSVPAHGQGRPTWLLMARCEKAASRRESRIVLATPTSEWRS